jgi:hypothetical protein
VDEVVMVEDMNNLPPEMGLKDVSTGQYTATGRENVSGMKQMAFCIGVMTLSFVSSISY